MNIADALGLDILYPKYLNSNELRHRFVYFSLGLIGFAVVALFAFSFIQADKTRSLEKRIAEHEKQNAEFQAYYYHRRALADSANAVEDSLHTQRVKEWERLIKKEKGSNESARRRQGVD